MINIKERLDKIMERLKDKDSLDRTELLMLVSEGLMYARILSAQKGVEMDIMKILEKELNIKEVDIEWKTMNQN